MTRDELAKEIAKGLIETGVEGPFDAVSCSTAGDYPSIGCSQWEGSRADTLLSYIDGGEKFIGRSYSDIEASGELPELAELLDSRQGHEAQLMILASDAMAYVESVMDAGLTDERCIIYAGTWCPTSHYVVARFIERRAERGEDVNNLWTLAELFGAEYAIAADCEEYADGYENRAWRTYEHVSELDLSEYGVSDYGETGED